MSLTLVNMAYLPNSSRHFACMYSCVQRWTKEERCPGGLGYYDIILLPLHHHRNHWCLAVLDRRRGTIEYYDSMRKSELHDETLRSFGVTIGNYLSQIDDTNWRVVDAKCAQQPAGNGYDCGVYALYVADRRSRDLPLQDKLTSTFITFLRERICFELTRGSWGVPCTRTNGHDTLDSRSEGTAMPYEQAESRATAGSVALDADGATIRGCAVRLGPSPSPL